MTHHPQTRSHFCTQWTNLQRPQASTLLLIDTLSLTNVYDRHLHVSHCCRPVRWRLHHIKFMTVAAGKNTAQDRFNNDDRSQVAAGSNTWFLSISNAKECSHTEGQLHHQGLMKDMHTGFAQGRHILWTLARQHIILKVIPSSLDQLRVVRYWRRAILVMLKSAEILSVCDNCGLTGG